MSAGSRKSLAKSEMKKLPLLLLDWYREQARDLPWRDRSGPADPYRVWISEVMLQQTTVSVVKPYFDRFIERWPDLEQLAEADQNEVLKIWAGLGYYARARNLVRTASIVVNQYGGRFPETVKELKKLPGIGPYTASAIAAIAFDDPTPVVDGNVERIAVRLFALRGDPKTWRISIHNRLNEILPPDRPGDFAQAMMDLGALVCRPDVPRCESCPLDQHCQALAMGLEKILPERHRKAPKPSRVGQVYVLTCGDEVYLERRRASGLLGGMLGFPSSPWSEQSNPSAHQAPVEGPWRRLAGRVRHTFTHFDLTLDVFRLDLDQGARRPPGEWVKIRDLDEAGLPSLMRKVAARALA